MRTFSQWQSVRAGFWCCLFLLGSVLPAHLQAQAQATTGVIRGIVSDSTGNPLTGAQLVLRNLETNAERTVTTNSRGVFVGSLLRVGSYTATARLVGYQAARREGLTLRLGEVLQVDFRLVPVTVQLADLTVAVSEPVVDPTRVASATRLEPQVVSGLPNNGRNFLNLTLLTPNVGIVQGPDGDELTIGGQRGIHNNVSVDGADFNNPFFGEQRGGQRPAFTFNLDAIQEIVVVSQGANAEFGRSGGASSTSSPSPAPTSSTAPPTISGSMTDCPRTSAPRTRISVDSNPTSPSTSSG